MTIWHPERRSRHNDAVRAALGYTGAAVLSIAAWVALASLMA